MVNLSDVIEKCAIPNAEWKQVPEITYTNSSGKQFILMDGQVAVLRAPSPEEMMEFKKEMENTIRMYTGFEPSILIKPYSRVNPNRNSFDL